MLAFSRKKSVRFGPLTYPSGSRFNATTYDRCCGSVRSGRGCFSGSVRRSGALPGETTPHHRRTTHRTNDSDDGERCAGARRARGIPTKRQTPAAALLPPLSPAGHPRRTDSDPQVRARARVYVYNNAPATHNTVFYHYLYTINIVPAMLYSCVYNNISTTQHLREGPNYRSADTRNGSLATAHSLAR